MSILKDQMEGAANVDGVGNPFTQHTPMPKLIFKESLHYATDRKVYQADLDDGTGLGATMIGPSFDRSLIEPIVLAVNAHEELLAAAKYFRSLVDADLLDALTRDSDLHGEAIAKAEDR